jgi:Na+-driven multidrug efflux pump
VGAVKKDIFIGVLISLFAIAGSIFLYIEYFSSYNFNETLKLIGKGDLYGKVLSLAAVPNLFIFFVFIRKKQDNRAKGVLLTTILIALTTLILKFF